MPKIKKLDLIKKLRELPKKGDKGERGEKGAKGDKGDKGIDGKDGKDGKDGERGPQGLQGEKGERGFKGEDGKNGKDGKDGEKGSRGFKGEDGEKGEKGEDGEKGSRGFPGKDNIVTKGDVTAGSAKILLAGTVIAAVIGAGFSIDVVEANIDHNALANTHNLTTDIDHGSISGLAEDDHTQYALLAGRSGGQTLIGGTASGNGLFLGSTSHATKGIINLGNSVYIDEVNKRLGIDTNNPLAQFEIGKRTGTGAGYTSINGGYGFSFNIAKAGSVGAQFEVSRSEGNIGTPTNLNALNRFILDFALYGYLNDSYPTVGNFAYVITNSDTYSGLNGNGEWRFSARSANDALGVLRKVFTASGNQLLFNENSNDIDTIIYDDTGELFRADAGAREVQISNVTKIGDGGTTNYAGFASDGFQTLYGDARYINHVPIDLNILTQGGGGTRPVGGEVGDYWVYYFTTGDYGKLSMKPLHDIDDSEDIEIHVTWGINEAYATGNGEVQWQIDWSLTPINNGETIDAPTHTGTVKSGDINIPAVANTPVHTTTLIIPAANYTYDDILGLQISRVTIDGGSNPSAEPYIIEMHLEYTGNKRGTHL